MLGGADETDEEAGFEEGVFGGVCCEGGRDSEGDSAVGHSGEENGRGKLGSKAVSAFGLARNEIGTDMDLFMTAFYLYLHESRFIPPNPPTSIVTTYYFLDQTV